MKGRLTRKLEEYLETIYSIKIQEGKKVVRIKDVAERMNVSMSTVTDAMNRLSELGYVDYQKREYIDLTEKGFKRAKELHETEDILVRFLTDFLQIDPEVSRKNACKMEHELDKKVIKQLEAFMKFLYECYGKQIGREFKTFLKEGKC